MVSKCVSTLITYHTALPNAQETAQLSLFTCGQMTTVTEEDGRQGFSG